MCAGGCFFVCLGGVGGNFGRIGRNDNSVVLHREYDIRQGCL